MGEPASRANGHVPAPALRLIARGVRTGLLFLVALAAAPVSVIMGKQRAARMTYWWYGRLLHALDIRVCMHGEVPKTPQLIVANHSSWLDILVLGHVFGAAFISKAEVDRWPFIGTYARITDTVFLARGANKTGEARAQIRARFARNHSVVLFAEGTTTDSPAPRRFHARLFAVAVDGRHAVLPVALRYSDHATPAGSHHPLVPWVGTSLLSNFVQVFRLDGLQVDVHVCDPIDADGHTRRSLAEASRNAIVRQTQGGTDGTADNG